MVTWEVPQREWKQSEETVFSCRNEETGEKLFMDILKTIMCIFKVLILDWLVKVITTIIEKETSIIGWIFDFYGKILPKTYSIANSTTVFSTL